jgi:hypothetical protein
VARNSINRGKNGNQLVLFGSGDRAYYNGGMPIPLFLIAALTLGSTPEDTVHKFVTAFNSGDLAAAAEQVLDAKTDSEFVKLVTKQLKEAKPGTQPKATVTIKKVEIKDLDATVEISTAIEPNGPPKPLEETIRLRKVGDDWKIVAPKYEPTDSRNSNEFVTTVATMLVSGDQAMAGAKHAAIRTSRLSNFKQISTACMIHATDHDDKILINTANARKALGPILKNDQIWQDPATKKTMTVSFNPNLLNKRLSEIQAPAETVLASWGPKDALIFDDSGRTVIAFTDGHVKLMTKEQAKTLRWKP